MAQIPYSPVPTVAPSEAPTPGFRLNTPEGAFGGGVAGATQGLGQSISSTGNELFGRAMAMQQLANESEAREADSNYMVAAGDLHAKYNSLQGKAAVDAYPEYANNLKELRVKMRDGLSSQTSQKMFDAQSLGTMGRSIFNGAGHAAAQNKAYAIGTATAQLGIVAKTVGDNPQDEGLFQDTLKKSADLAAHTAALHGAPAGSPQEQLAVLTATSGLWKERITGLSRTAPFDAAKMLDANKTQMTQDDYLRVDNTVRASGRAVGSVNIANGVYQDGTKNGQSLAQMEETAKAKAAEQDPNDPLLATHTVAALRGQYNQDKYAKKQFDAENIEMVNGGIAAGVKNVQELRANPQVAAAIDALPPDKQNAIPGMINRYNAARDKVSNEENYFKLKGMASNDVEGFLNTDLTSQGLAKGDIDKLMTLQKKLKAIPDSDPRVNRAVTQIRGAMGAQLEALGIFKYSEKNKDDYNKYTGALQQALDVFQETNKRPPNYKELTENIAPEVLRTVQEPGWLWGTNDVPRFKQAPPNDFAEKLITDVKSKGGIEPTPEQIQRAYARTQFMQLYGKKKDGQ